jgi:hypothetical protein
MIFTQMVFIEASIWDAIELPAKEGLPAGGE